MSDPTTIEARAEKAYRVLLNFADESEAERDEAAIDLMTDLLHLLDEGYGDAEAVHRIAWDHYTTEKQEALR